MFLLLTATHPYSWIHRTSFIFVSFPYICGCIYKCKHKHTFLTCETRASPQSDSVSVWLGPEQNCVTSREWKSRLLTSCTSSADLLEGELFKSSFPILAPMSCFKVYRIGFVGCRTDPFRIGKHSPPSVPMYYYSQLSIISPK